MRGEHENKIANIVLRDGRRIGPKLAKFIVSFVLDTDPNAAY